MPKSKRPPAPPESMSLSAICPRGMKRCSEPRAARLTGEQRLRLATRGAWLRNPSILLLDEATSSLDAAAENGVAGTLDELRRGRTVILVTPRLSHAISADRIDYLEEGRLIESGTHGELLDQQGRYAAMWQKQSGFVIEGNGDRIHVELERLPQFPSCRAWNPISSRD